MKNYKIEEILNEWDIIKIEDFKSKDDLEALKYYKKVNKKLNEWEYYRELNLIFLWSGVFKYLIKN